MIVTCILLPRWLFNIPGVLYEIHDVILILTIHVATNLARKDDDILSLNKSGKQELTHLMRVAVSHSLGVPRGDVRWVGRKKSNFQYRWFLLLASSLKIRGNVQGGEKLFCWFWFYYNQCSMVFYPTSMKLGNCFGRIWVRTIQLDTFFCLLFEKERRNLVIGRAGNALLSSVCFFYSIV